MGAYKPMQRTVTARVLTSAGWLEGQFHLAVHQGFAEFLAREAGYYRLTDVHWPGASTLPFLALHHGETLAVLPDPKAPMLKVAPVAPQEKSHVTCLLPGGWITGDMEHLAHTRLSDSMERFHGFVVLENAELTLRGQSPVSAPLALVNAERLVGLSGHDTTEVQAPAPGAPQPRPER